VVYVRVLMAAQGWVSAAPGGSTKLEDGVTQRLASDTFKVEEAEWSDGLSGRPFGSDDAPARAAFPARLRARS